LNETWLLHQLQRLNVRTGVAECVKNLGKESGKRK